MITLKINGQDALGEENQYILEVAEKYGIDIPTICHHKNLEPAGFCRMCTVEVSEDGKTEFMAACHSTISEGMEIYTDSEAVLKNRKILLELMLSKYPNDPAIRNLAEKNGVRVSRFSIRKKAS